MQGTVDASLDDIDGVLLVLDCRARIGAGDRYVARRVFSLGVPVIIALNKVDRLKAGHIATQMKTAATLGDFHALHPVSAKTGDGIGELRGDLVVLLPEGPLYFPADQVTDVPVEVQIAELVREQALRMTKEEVPHAIAVVQPDIAVNPLTISTPATSKLVAVAIQRTTSRRWVGWASEPWYTAPAAPLSSAPRTKATASSRWQKFIQCRSPSPSASCPARTRSISPVRPGP